MFKRNFLQYFTKIFEKLDRKPTVHKYLLLSISDYVLRIAVNMIIPKRDYLETLLFKSTCKNYISSHIAYSLVDILCCDIVVFITSFEFIRIFLFILKYAYILRLIIKKVYTWIRCCHLIICHLLQFEIISDIFKHLKLLILPPSHNIFS